MPKHTTAHDLLAYLRARLGLLCALILAAGLIALILFLDNVSTTVILDISLALLPLLLVAISLDVTHWLRELRVLRQLPTQLSADLLTHLPETTDARVQLYRDLLAAQLARLNATQNTLTADSQALNEHFATWSHQMKTPLAALDLLLQMTPINQAGARLEVRKVERYIQMMLAFVRLNNVSDDLILTNTALTPLVKKTVRELAHLFIGKDLAVQVDPLPQVVTDQHWLGFILEQLLTNAAKYTPSGNVHIYFAGGALVIADTGIGILPQDLPRLFDRGFSGYNGHANAKATGLGLYMSQTVADKMGLHITITSTVGEGTQAAIHFPQTTWHTE